MEYLLISLCVGLAWKSGSRLVTEQPLVGHIWTYEHYGYHDIDG